MTLRVFFMSPSEFGRLVLWRQFMEQDNPDATIVATNGCFDIIHAGHIQMLEDSKKKGDFLVVGINSDSGVKKLKGSSRPINSQDNRKRVLRALKMVDAVFVFDGERADTFLKYAQPHVYVKAGDYSLDTLDRTEHEVLTRLRTKIIFTPFIDGFSTTNIIKNLK